MARNLKDNMKKPVKIFWLLLALVVLVGILVTRWFQRQQAIPLAPTPAVISEPVSTAPPPATAAPSVDAVGPHYPIVVTEPTPTGASPKPVPLPALDASDVHVQRSLAEFISNKDMVRFLQIGQFVRHVVATIDSLPREHASTMVWPINPMPGHFSTGDGDESHPLGPTTIHVGNAARYSAFVDFVSAVKLSAAVAFYVRLYPLFQQAYSELGYPKAYFNDRLVAVIDHLLAVPVQTAALAVSRVEVRGPYQPVRPWITYEFTDPALRDLSAGQKMLLRAGSANHKRLRTQLMEIRGLLTQEVAATPERPS